LSNHDIVYFLKEDLPLDGAELRYSLRSLVNFPHHKVWMVTPTLPDWVDSARVILVDHLPEHKDKYADLSEKWKWLGTNEDMPRKIVYMDDDYYVIKPVKRPPSRSAHYSLSNHIRLNEEYNQKLNIPAKNSTLLTALKNTERLLIEREAPLLHPIQHVPWLVKRKNIPVHWEDGRGPYDWKILEFNHKPPKNVPNMLHENKTYSVQGTIQILERGWRYISSGEQHWVDSGLGNWFRKLFPYPSVYELS